MHAHTPSASTKPVITAFGSHTILAPLQYVAHHTDIHLRMGGFSAAKQSTALALHRVRRLVEREQRLNVEPAAKMFIEITSRTALMQSGSTISDEHLIEQHPELFDNPRQTEAVWNMLAIPDPDLRLDALENSPLDLSKREVSNLASITLGQVNHEQMRKDLDEIKQHVPNFVLVLPYCRVEKPEHAIKLQNRLAHDLSGLAKKVGIKTFDPAPLVARLGQNLVFGDTPKTQDHYTSGFIRLLGTNLSTQFLSELTNQVSPLARRESEGPIISASGGI